MATVDRAEIRDGYRQAREAFHDLLAQAGPADLRRPTNGTRWTNEQLLFHMLFGYLVVRALLPIVHLFALLPDGASRRFARLLDAGTRPFDTVNYLGSCGGARVIDHRRMGAVLDRTLASLLARLDREPERHLAGTMAFPARWDPFFADRMALAEVYRYPTQHFTFHAAQLTLGNR